MPENNPERRQQLVLAAQQLFYEKGYENASVTDIANAVSVSKGAFYHYFDSKTAVLAATVEVVMAEYAEMIKTVRVDDSLDAIAKFNQLIQVISNWEISQKEKLLALMRIVRLDANLRLQHQLTNESTKLFISAMVEIIEEGMEEGLFDMQHAQEAAEFTFAIMGVVSDALTDMILDPAQYENPIELARIKVQMAQTAVSRILGSPVGLLPLMDEATLITWFAD